MCIKHLLIHYITVVKLFSLQRLNKRILEFNFGSVECKNRPSEIASHHLSSSGELKQSGQNLYCKLLLEVSLLKMRLISKMQLVRCGVSAVFSLSLLVT